MQKNWLKLNYIQRYSNFRAEIIQIFELLIWKINEFIKIILTLSDLQHNELIVQLNVKIKQGLDSRPALRVQYSIIYSRFYQNLGFYSSSINIRKGPSIKDVEIFQGGFKFRWCKILEGRSQVNQGQNSDMGEGGIKNSQKSFDVIYGQPLRSFNCLFKRQYNHFSASKMVAWI